MEQESQNKIARIYKLNDEKRLLKEPVSSLSPEDYRSNYWRDYARVLHSPSFRRLKGKTQLFPNHENDFFRNRLTHSLEVAQIAKSIAKKLNYEFNLDIDEDLVSLAGLAHDIGHPPFGHQGEEALDKCMIEYGGFEGNAQTLRILTRIEKKIIDTENPSGVNEKGRDLRAGLNLTSRSIASILKYDNIIPRNHEQRLKFHESRGEPIHPIKGYYESEKEIVEQVKFNICGNKNIDDFKTIECQIMDLADDIAYSNYDLEDAIKAGFLSPIDLLYPSEELLQNVTSSLNRRLKKTHITKDTVNDVLISLYDSILHMPNDIEKIKVTEANKEGLKYVYVGQAYRTSNNISKNGALRTQLTSKLVGKFIRGVQLNLNDELPQLSKVKFDEETLLEVEVLKTLTFESQILSPKLKIAELRGKEIVTQIFKTIENENGHLLLPDDYQELFNRVEPGDRKRIICDFVAGMTNEYAISFYGRITSENPETIFKPL